MIDNTTNKINLKAYVDYCSSFDLVHDLLQKANKDKPTDKLSAMISAMRKIALYVNHLDGNISKVYAIAEEYKEDKIRAVLRARKSEDERQSLEEENLMLTDKFKLKL